MKQRGSNLVTKAGIVILVVVLLTAAYFRMDTLVVLTTGLLIISVAAYLWTLSALSNLEFFAAKTIAEGFPGETLTVHASLENRKVLPVVWLRLSLPQAESEGNGSGQSDSVKHVAGVQTQAEPEGNGTGQSGAGKSTSGTSGQAERTGNDARKGICVRTPEENGVIRSFLWLMPHQSVSWDMTLTGERRGVLMVSRLGITGGDGFGLAEQERMLQLKYPLSFVVFPQPVPVDTTVIRKRVQHLEQSGRGTYEDVTLLRNIRDYQYGDNARRINMRQAARTGELFTNVYEKQEMRHAAIALDTESFVCIEELQVNGEKHYCRRTMETQFEETVSLAASAALDLLSHGLCCTMLIGEERITAMTPSDGTRILRMLAAADPSAKKEMLPTEAAFSFRHLDGPMFLFTRTVDARIGAWLDEWRDQGAHVICMSGNAGADPAVAAAGELRG